MNTIHPTKTTPTTGTQNTMHWIEEKQGDASLQAVWQLRMQIDNR